VAGGRPPRGASAPSRSGSSGEGGRGCACVKQPARYPSGCSRASHARARGALEKNGVDGGNERSGPRHGLRVGGRAEGTFAKQCRGQAERMGPSRNRRAGAERARPPSSSPPNHHHSPTSSRFLLLAVDQALLDAGDVGRGGRGGRRGGGGGRGRRRRRRGRRGAIARGRRRRASQGAGRRGGRAWAAARACAPGAHAAAPLSHRRKPSTVPATAPALM